MTVLAFSRETENFAQLIERRLGLRYEDSRYPALGEALQARARARRVEPAQYLLLLQSPAEHGEWRALAQILTVGETYFFRHIEQFRAFAEAALPDRLAAAGNRKLRVLSAGCSTGEEPYTLAMLVCETMPDRVRDVSIVALDLNAEALEKARAAEYPSWALRETPPPMLEKYFRRRGERYQLDDRIRAMVRYEERNLLDEEAALWHPASYDIIFCRNVLMYFGAQTMRRVVARFARALAPGGYLFAGHAETLRGASPDFHLCHTHGSFYYRHRATSAQIVVEEPPAPATLIGILDQDRSWAEAIRLSTEQVASLAPDVEIPVTPDAPARDLRAATDLLRHERYAEALIAMEDMPMNAEGDIDALLLRAVLLTHVGDLDQAARVCEEVLQIDGLSASAQYVLALCHEAAGDLRAARERDLLAAHLDPDFAMPHLHLGLLARKSGDLALAARELEQALSLLPSEEPGRLLLFGGGFGRNALVGLCRAELEVVQRGGVSHG
jgi:chemotaxis protein methyltransferase CheR